MEGEGLVTLQARGTALVAGLILVTVLVGLGFYGRQERPGVGKGNCYCERWKSCGFADPNDCACCTDLGGCRAPKGGPSCCAK